MPTCRGAERTGHAGSPCADDLGARKVGLWCSVEMVEFACERLQLAVRPEGANHQWRKNPPGELSIDPVADERLVRVTAWVGAS
jgi:hypothetical protein